MKINLQWQHDQKLASSIPNIDIFYFYSDTAKCDIKQANNFEDLFILNIIKVIPLPGFIFICFRGVKI